MASDPRFGHMDLENMHLSDLLEWYDESNLVGITDKDDGGIIAYCHIGNADRIVTALTKSES